MLMEVDCGLCYITDEQIKESLIKRVSGDVEARSVERMVFGSIGE